jgi:hypothetical protein
VRRGHAADGEQFLGPHPFRCHVEQFTGSAHERLRATPPTPSTAPLHPPTTGAV